MTNEEKAKEIELNVYAFEKPKEKFEAPAYRAALEMAEYKDQQFKEYLEKLKDKCDKQYSVEISNNDYIVGKAYGRLCIVIEIINELFPKIEQDNSDRKE